MTTFKLILCGPKQCGKTSLVTRLLNREFNEYVQPSMGASYSVWTPNFLSIKEEMENISFSIWDTFGHDRYKNVLSIYLTHADAVFYCCEYTSKFSSKDVKNIYDLTKKMSPSCHFYVAITKMDKKNTLDNCLADAEQWSTEHMIEGIFYTSSLDGGGVYQLFADMAKRLADTPRSDSLEFNYNLSEYRSPGFFNLCCNML